MSSQVVHLSAKNNEGNKKSLQFGSCSSRSERPISASKSAKRFEESLRKYDSINSKPEDHASPLKKRLSFGRNDQNMSSESEIYIIDIKKRIKRVDSPFLTSQKVLYSQQKQQISETNMLVSSFNSISQKAEELNQSSSQIEKAKQEPSQFQNLTLKINQIINHFEYVSEDRQVCFQEDEVGQNGIQCCQQDPQKDIILDLECLNKEENKKQQEISQMSIQKSSLNAQSKSHQSQLIRLRKKNKKRIIRKQKRKIAKSMKEKLRNISTFFDFLHQKQSQTGRKQLIEQLTSHLCEKKFVRLRNQLKKLI